jgi:cell division protein FtsA
LAGNSSEEISSPLYATAVGLVMNSIENNSNSAYKIELKEVEKQTPKVVFQPEIQEKIEEVSDVIEEEIDLETETTENKIKRSFFDRYVEKIKDFLDNAE